MAKQEIVGRNLEMSEIIGEIHENRLVTIIGFPGIGKTTIAEAVGVLLEEREKYSDGILFISMRKRQQANMLIQELYFQIKKNLKVKQLEDLNEMVKEKKKNHEMSKNLEMSKIMVNNEEFEDIDERLITFNQLNLDKIIFCLQERQVLIILDNIEDTINTDAENLKEIMHQILLQCPNVKFLTTSRSLLNKVGSIEEQVI
jgi:energy-coupling factor transporter ATP-binding protein EcfA2